MDAFGYLSVLVSIILGLGITQLLTGVGRLLAARTRVRWYWPAMAWVGVLLVIHIQAWWAMFELRTHAGWTFPAFFVVLLLPIVLYLAAALALPDVGGDAPVDLRASYYAHAGWAYAMAALVIVASFVRPYALGDRRALDADTAVHALFLAGTVGAALSRREWYHKLMVLFFAALLTLYVLVLFDRLR
ncbi:MAG TPA: hypothetical protein VFJ74_05195 [Gemmatimonadaceae bacterium]|nr:hypothetical protein [Gemmatimonadaceae bacterium]